MTDPSPGVNTPNPTGAEVAAYCGRSNDAPFVAQCEVAVGMARALARAYCRGVGFPNEDMVNVDLRPVIVMRAARIATNPLGNVAESVDGQSATDASAASGFSVGEQLILNGFRRRAT